MIYGELKSGPKIRQLPKSFVVSHLRLRRIAHLQPVLAKRLGKGCIVRGTDTIDFCVTRGTGLVYPTLQRLICSSVALEMLLTARH